MRDHEGKPAERFEADAGYAVAGLAAVALALVLPPMQAAITAGFWLLVLVVVRSDVRSFTIPDEASAGIALLGLAAAAFAGEGDRLAAAGVAAAQGAGAFAVIAAMRWLHGRITGREGIGFGDVKLAGALGFWLDLAGQALTLQLAAIAALIVVVAARRAGRADADVVPFGAFLAPAAFAVHALGLLAPEILGGVP